MSQRTFLGAIAASALALTASSSALAYDVKTTPNGSLVHWQNDRVQFTFDPSTEAISGSRAALLAAFGAWGGHDGAPVMDDEAKSAPTAPGYDGLNGVFYMPGGYEPAGKALAITVLTFDNSTGAILDADIIVNGMYQFKVLPAPDANAANAATASPTDGSAQGDAPDQGDVTAVYDFAHVIAHETGHSLGMADEYVGGSALMYRYTAPDDASMRAPQTDDYQGLAKIYGSSIQAEGGCGGATVSPVKPTHHEGTAAFAFGAGLMIYVVLRRRGAHAKKTAAFFTVAVLAIASVPEVSGARAHAATFDASMSRGHASAIVTSTRTTNAAGIFRTEMNLQTSECRIGNCPKTATFATWGGTIGNITQEVDGRFAPKNGDAVDLSYAHAPSSLAALENPLAARNAGIASLVRIVTKAR